MKPARANHCFRILREDMKAIEAHFEGKMYSDLKSEIADLVISKLERSESSQRTDGR